MDWEHLITVCHPDVSGNRIPAVRVTKEKGSRLPELRLSYTFCFYDVTEDALYTVLHVPGKHAEAFAEVFVIALSTLRYSGTADPDMLAMRVVANNARALPPDIPVKGHKGGPPRKAASTNLGDLLKRKMVRTHQ